MKFRQQVYAQTVAHQKWFDLRVEYDNRKRAAVALDEKGLPEPMREFCDNYKQLEEMARIVKNMDMDVSAKEVVNAWSWKRRNWKLER